MGKLRSWLVGEQAPVSKGATEVEAAFLAYVQEMEDSYGLSDEAQYTPSTYSLTRKGEVAEGTLWCVYDYMYGEVYILDGSNGAEVFVYKAAENERFGKLSGAIAVEHEGLVEAFKDDPDALAESPAEAILKYLERKVEKHDRYVVVKAEGAQRYTLGVAYPANEVDSHGDFADAEQLEETAWNFMRSSQNVGTDHAEGTDYSGTVVESYVYRGPDWQIGEEKVEAGDWMLGVVWDEPTWERIENNELTGYSIQGVAMIDPDAEAPDGE